MGRYCNLNKRRVENCIIPILHNLLKETEYMDFERALFQINLRTQNISVRNKTHKRNMTYAINFYFQSFEKFIQQSNDFGMLNEMGKRYIYSKKRIDSEWVIINEID